MEKFIFQFMAVILHIVIVSTINSLCEHITSQFTSAFLNINWINPVRTLQGQSESFPP